MSITLSKFKMDPSTRAVLLSWLEHYKISRSDIDPLPKLGLTVFYCNKPVAIAFIRKVEGNMGMSDFLIADPHAPPHVKDSCLNRLGQECLSLAKREGMRALLTFSGNPKVIQRAISLGFSDLKYTLYSIALETGKDTIPCHP